MRYEWAAFKPIAAKYLAHRAPVTKVCLHTTEGTTLGGAYTTLADRGVPSHLLCDLHSDEHWQLLDSNQAAHSLYHVDQSGVIQIELVGFAKDVPWYGDIWYSRLAALLRRVCTAENVPLVVVPGDRWPMTANEGYGKNAPHRLSFAEWDATAGVVGHCHAPARWWLSSSRTNGHWDPGGLNVDLLQTYLYAPSKDPQMQLVIDTEGPDAGDAYIVGMPRMVDVTHSGARAIHEADFKAAGAVIELRYGGDIVRKGYGLS